MKLSVIVGIFLATASVAAQKDSKAFVRVAPEQVLWVDVPERNGIQMATIEGDPTKTGIYVIRIKFPPGMMSRPHHHREDRHAVVLKGTWWTGTGDVFAPEKTIPLKIGSYMKHPAGETHFDGAKNEEVILQIVGYGPTSTDTLRPGDGNWGPSLKK